MCPQGVPLADTRSRTVGIESSRNVNYSSQMFEVMQPDEFEEWLDGLRDRKGQEVVTKRVIRMQSGLLGDVKAVGSGVSEARIKFGRDIGSTS